MGKKINREPELLEEIRTLKERFERLESIEVKYRRSEEILRSIVEATSAKTGTEFIRSLVKNFALIMKVRYALVGMAINGARSVKTLAVWANGRFAENFEYGLEGTPCNNVVGRTMCYYPSSVAKLFPEDRLLAEMGVESYLGVPLFDSRGTPLGLMAALDDKPLDDEYNSKSLLSIFSARVGAEMERERAVEALKRSEASLANAQRIARVGNWEWDMEKNQILWSGELYRIFGVEKGSPVTLETFMERIHPEDLDEMKRVCGYVIREKKGVSYDYRLKLPDGTVRFVRGCGEAFTDPASGATTLTGTVQDVTEIKLAESELQKYREHLEDLVEERTSELTEVNERLRLEINERKKAEKRATRLNEDLSHHVARLEEANRELEAFSYSLAHDLGAPLRVIDGFSKMLLKYYGDRLEGEGREFIETITSNSLKMGRLITDLLNLARLARQEMRFTEVDMRRLADATFAELRVSAKGRDIELVLTPLPPAYGEKTMLTQVFSNLLSNAVKFTRPREKAVIEIDGWTEAEENIYSVKDNGVGFDMKHRGRLFGVFKRLHTEDEFEGAGAGLAITQRIIQRHGGRVWAEGRVGHGAAFYFAIPLRSEKKPKA